jgi:hypothetical protein
MSSRIFTDGRLLVTGEGQVNIEEMVPKSRALLVHPADYVSVCFDPHDHHPPPCGHHRMVDEVDWELYMHHVREPRANHPEEELRLRIRWKVSTPRTVIWQIKIPT